MPRNRSRDLIRIGDRDGWVCGICRDPARPVHRPLGAVTIVASDPTLEDVPAGAQPNERGRTWSKPRDVMPLSRHHRSHPPQVRPVRRRSVTSSLNASCADGSLIGLSFSFGCSIDMANARRAALC